MAASSESEIDQLEELEELFGGDTTDDLFICNEIESSSESPVSAKDNFLSTNVSLSSLKLVLERLADRQSNFVEEEQAVASIISKVEEGTFAEFLTSVAGLFEECFHLRSSKKNKHLGAIELEKNFNACRTKSNPASKAWDEILLGVGVEKNTASDSLYQHVLQHFWSTVGSVSVQQENTERTMQPDSQPADDMEVEAVTDHAGWAIKRARDIIKSSTETNLRIKKSSGEEASYKIDKSVALEFQT